MPWLSCIISNVLLASLVALSAWFVQRRLRLSAVGRILWVLVMVKLLTPPLVSVPLVEFPSTMACALGLCHCAQHAGTLTGVAIALPWILLVGWASGAAITFWIACRRWMQFQRLTAHATAAPLLWQTLAARLASELSIRRPPEILAVPGRLPPLVVPGWRRPRMLVPSALLSRLDASQGEALLLHELMHIKRGDHLVRMLELAVGVAFWWLPLVRSIGRGLRDCEETCCDAAVVAHLPRGRRDYAQLLLDVVEFANPLPPQALPQATAMSAAEGLEQRLKSILDGAPETRRTWPASALAVCLACAVLPCGVHYDFDGTSRATISKESEPAAAARSTGGVPAVDISAFCCPSFEARTEDGG